jgi:hypothetical protein
MKSKMYLAILILGQFNVTAIIGAMAINLTNERGMVLWFPFAWMAMTLHVLVASAVEEWSRGKVDE